MKLGELVDTGRLHTDGRKIFRDTETGEHIVLAAEVEAGESAPAQMPLWGWIAFGIAGLAAGGAITYFVAKRSKKRRRR
jgi:hypothetical protein